MFTTCASDGRIVTSTSFSLAVGMMSSAQIFDGILFIVLSSCLADIGANFLSSGTLHLSLGLYGCILLNLLWMLSILSWKKLAKSSASALLLVAFGSGLSYLQPSRVPTS